MERAERIEPFAGLHFNLERCGDLAAVVAPPYDLIGPQRQQELYDRSPYNIVRIELNREQERYGAAAATLERWLREGILVRAATPAIYLYRQTFSHEGQRLTRNGFVVTLRLDEFAPGRILPHERTFSAPKEDRLRLLSALQINSSSIFGLYPGDHPELDRVRANAEQRAPLFAVRDDLGIDNELRIITEPAEIKALQSALSSPRILIADGHHRYETALNYRRQRREMEHDPAALAPYDYVMMTLTSCDDPGLLILPTHRVVRQIDGAAMAAFGPRIEEFFAVEEFSDPEQFAARLKAAGRGVLGVALRGDPRLRLLRLKDAALMASSAPHLAREVRELDVSVLHTLVFDRILGIDEAAVRAASNIDYTVDTRGALASVRDGTAAGAFLMNPPSIAEVERVSDAGATMPEKSTYFYPKLLTGLVMNPLRD